MLLMPQAQKRPAGEGFAAIVLAAGQSRRMGSNKNLLPINGKPLIAHVVENIATSRCVEDITVVTGHEPDRLLHALHHLKYRRVHNPDYAAGEMISSIKTGVRALPEGLAGFFIVLADQPHIGADVYDHLAASQRDSNAAIVLPTYLRKRGHPILIASQRRRDLLCLPDDKTLRDLIAMNSSDLLEVPVAEPAVIHDLDTPHDYEQFDP